ncbi:uncharacterized protein LOC116033009 isoform X1 [Ipomoea triloba]|uniref:uncharacterized protein LOC116033009 isoform X1 n=1 Tax=Ipomoea triloba TaxID=35885 RepID=UPI00125D1F29|nr:uncharacterized protein LOC116033009 isoform X1 [Ipomoea triloba]
MALLRLIVVVAVALFLLGAWASQATAHTNHVNKATSNYVKINGFSGNNVNYAPANPKPEKKFQNRPRNSNNNGGTQYTQFADPTVNNNYFPTTNFVDTTNKVEETTETMAEPPQSGTCDGKHRAFGGWLAVIIAVSLYHHHRL